MRVVVHLNESLPAEGHVLDQQPSSKTDLARRRRFDSVDALRGLVMILMTLDHVRDYFGGTGINPTNLATTTLPLFTTRWVTHFCAPVFFLLTGTGAYLSRFRVPVASLPWYLVKRGIWLIVLDAVVLRCLGWQFNFDYRVTVLNVLWALGWSMIGLAALVRLPNRIAMVIGVLMIVGHNALDGVRPAAGLLASLWRILHVQGVVFASPNHVVFTAYPLVPWVGVVAVGYALGAAFEWSPEQRRRLFAQAGAVLSIAFLIVRWTNVYGDPVQWSAQPSQMLTVLSFLNTTKYPPSLAFLLMTLGPAMLLLSVLEGRTWRVLGALITFGRVPLFYFATHIILIHGLAVVVCWVRFGGVHWMFESPDLAHFPFTEPSGWAVRLEVVYALWLLVVASLFPLCARYARVKSDGSQWWLRYL